MTVKFDIPKEQRAWYLEVGAKQLTKKIIPVPTPPPGSALVRINAAGVCHSDLHLIHGTIPTPGPIIPGHESSGTIVSLGPGVNENAFPIGGRFAIHTQNSCGYCNLCRSGHDNICQVPVKSQTQIGLGHPGGYQEYTTIPVRSLIRIPDGVSDEAAAVATDAILTPYHALKKVRINGSTRILILGLGGLGLNAVTICKHFGAHVTAMDPKASAREAGKNAGADAVLEKFPPRSMNFDVVADFVGLKQTFAMAQKHVRHLGHIITVGMGHNYTEYENTKMSYKEMTTIGSYNGTTQELAEVLDLIAKGRITPQITVRPLDDINDVLNNLDKGDAVSRVVVSPKL